MFDPVVKAIFVFFWVIEIVKKVSYHVLEAKITWLSDLNIGYIIVFWKDEPIVALHIEVNVLDIVTLDIYQLMLNWIN